MISKYLPLIGRVLTPVAMVVFLSHEIYTSQKVEGYWAIAVLIGAVATAVGVEVVGILTGHAVEGFSRTKDYGRLAVSLLLLAVYTGAGIAIMWDTGTLIVIPVIAAVVYLVSALVDGLEVQVATDAKKSEAREAFDLEQEAMDREHERQEAAKAAARADENELALRLAEEEAKTAVAISENDTKVKVANAKAREAKAKMSNIRPKASETEGKAIQPSVNLEDLTPKQRAVYEAFREDPKATNVKVAKLTNLTPQYVGQIKKDLNGAIHQ